MMLLLQPHFVMMLFLHPRVVMMLFQPHVVDDDIVDVVFIYFMLIYVDVSGSSFML
jgi:hypothetical protein